MSAASAAGLLGGWLVDGAAGDPRRGHPVAGFGQLAVGLEEALWADRRVAGAVYAGVLIGAPTVAVALLDRRLSPRGRLCLQVAVTWAALGGRSLGRAAREVAEAVRRNDLDHARRLLPALCGRDPSALDAAGLCRAATESVAENTSDAVVAPLLWGALAGPAGVIAHRCANTLDAMVGYRTPRHGRFGWASARTDDALGWAPARVTALLATVLAPVAGGSRGGAWRAWRRDGAAHPSPNAGRCEAAFAGALGVTLGGTNVYGTRAEQRATLGDGPPPGPAEVDRAVRLSTVIGAAAAVLAAAGRGAVLGSTWRKTGCGGVGRSH